MHCALLLLAVGALAIGSVGASPPPLTFPTMRIPSRYTWDSELAWYLGSHPMRGIRAYDNDVCQDDEHGGNFIRLNPLANWARCLPINNATSIKSNDPAKLNFYLSEDCDDSTLLGDYHIAPDECAKVELGGKHFQSVKIYPICVYGLTFDAEETWCAGWPTATHMMKPARLNVTQNSHGLRKYEPFGRPGESTWNIA